MTENVGTTLAAGQYPKFVDDGNITAAGHNLLEWIEVQFSEADQKNDLAKLNNLHGPIAEYYTIVHKLHQISPYDWLSRFKSSVNNAYEIMRYVEAEVLKETQTQQTQQETTDRTKTLESELAKLKETVDETVLNLQKERDELKKRLEALEKKPADKPADKKPETDASTQGETETPSQE